MRDKICTRFINLRHRRSGFKVQILQKNLVCLVLILGCILCSKNSSLATGAVVHSKEAEGSSAGLAHKDDANKLKEASGSDLGLVKNIEEKSIVEDPHPVDGRLNFLRGLTPAQVKLFSLEKQKHAQENFDSDPNTILTKDLLFSAFTNGEYVFDPDAIKHDCSFGDKNGSAPLTNSARFSKRGYGSSFYLGVNLSAGFGVKSGSGYDLHGSIGLGLASGSIGYQYFGQRVYFAIEGSGGIGVGGADVEVYGGISHRSLKLELFEGSLNARIGMILGDHFVLNFLLGGSILGANSMHSSDLQLDVIPSAGLNIGLGLKYYVKQNLAVVGDIVFTTAFSPIDAHNTVNLVDVIARLKIGVEISL